MFCEKCGTEINDDAMFCSKCGQSVVKSERTIQTIEYANNSDTRDKTKIITNNKNSKNIRDVNEKWQILSKSENEKLKEQILANIKKIKKSNNSTLVLSLAVSVFILVDVSIPIGLIFIIYDIGPYIMRRKDISLIEESLDTKAVCMFKNHCYWSLGFSGAKAAEKLLENIETLDSIC